MQSSDAPTSPFVLAIPGLTTGDIAAAIERGAYSAAADVLATSMEVMWRGIPLTKQQAAKLLDVSERTIENLWAERKLEKLTALGERMPRVSLGAVIDFMASQRVRPKTAKLRVLPTEDAA
jgi:hypothetical protein